MGALKRPIKDDIELKKKVPRFDKPDVTSFIGRFYDAGEARWVFPYAHPDYALPCEAKKSVIGAVK